MELTALERRLVNEFQRDFPLVATPFAEIAQRLGSSEATVLGAFRRLHEGGLVSRVGPVFRPHRIGVSTLAAMAVPPERLADVAELVSSYREVNHNYEREHRFNLWFVVTAPDWDRIHELLAELRQRTGIAVLFLPMLADYHIDLGFPLEWDRDAPVSLPPHYHGTRLAGESPHSVRSSERHLATPLERKLIAEVQQGLPLESRPYAAIGACIGSSESETIQLLAKLLEHGVIRRLGVVVRHHELGYRANAMVVWNVPDEQVDSLGRELARFPFVTLCYQRARSLPDWPYNLYCMIHGQSRDVVLAHIKQLLKECNAGDIPHEVLFSQRRFKQRGAVYELSAVSDRRSGSPEPRAGDPKRATAGE